MTPARFFAAFFALTPLGLGVSCGQSAGGTDGAPSYPASAPAGRCGAVVQQHAIEGHTHVPTCSEVEYGTKPPSSGNHYPAPAAYGTYVTPVPEGFWVHDLEHGAIVISYNCPGGCQGDVAAAAQMLAALPQDPECVSLGEGIFRRVLVTPDPKLDVRFAASAWGWTLRANCFDAAPFQAFALAHYNLGPEDLCAGGVAPVCGGGLPADAASDALAQSGDAAGDGPTPSADATSDAPGESPDSSGEAGGSRCAAPSDCRKFSNYCGGCACNALGASDPAPACDAGTVSCLLDPCNGHAAVCATTGQCALQ